MKYATLLAIIAPLSWLAHAAADVQWIVQSANGTTILSGSEDSGDPINISVDGLSGGPARTIKVWSTAGDNIGRISIYGSGSPPEIKLHVDSLSGPPTSMYTSTANAAGELGRSPERLRR